MKERWIHYRPYKWISFLTEGKTTACGKTARRIESTKDENAVTCQLCIDEMKTRLYFCAEHGFINGVDVAFDEKCDYCGESVVTDN